MAFHLPHLISRWVTALGVISFTFSVIMAAMYALASEPMVKMAGPIVGVILFCGWIGGVWVGTFDAPFTGMCAGGANGMLAGINATRILILSNSYVPTFVRRAFCA